LLTFWRGGTEFSGSVVERVGRRVEEKVVRSRMDASRCLISLRYLWPDNPSADRFPQPPNPLDDGGSGSLFDKRD